MIDFEKQEKIFNRIKNDGKWNKFSIGDNETEWVGSLSDEEYYAVSGIRSIRNSLITYATKGVYIWNESKGKCDIFPFLGYRSGMLEVTSVYFPEKYFHEVKTTCAPSSVNTRLRCKVKCDCGNEGDFGVHSVKSKKTTHCGCQTVPVPPTTLDIVDGRLVTDANLNVDKNGYVSCSIRNGEYNGQTFHGPFSEHQLIYQMYHGITLKKNQNIHHKNGVRNDNHIDNLELWDTSQPAGQRVMDKISYYFKLIKSHSDNPLYKEEIESQLFELKNLT